MTADPVQESYADYAAAISRDSYLARDSHGWKLISQDSQTGMNAQARKDAAQLIELMAVGNPLIKRGLALRVSYVWGSPDGNPVSITVRDDGQEGQDVNAVLQEFLERNHDTFTGSQAREDMERNGLGTYGEVFISLFTERVTGRVSVRRILPSEITSIVNNPEDYAQPWLYLREWTAATVNSDGIPTGAPVTRRAYYPALGWSPARRPRNIDGVPVMWDAPVIHVAVNTTPQSDRGIGDAFAALPWAKISKEFLEQTAMLLSALSRYAWQSTARGDRTQQAAQRIAASQTPGQVGDTVVQTVGEKMEAVAKSSATINPALGHPYQVMVAAALGLPVTILLGDPGTTGARSVAETLDAPTEMEFGLRRDLWATVIRRVADYVIDQAVISPGGPLTGSVVRDGDTLEVVLPESDTRLVDIAWPSFKSTPLSELLDALAKADSLDKMPPLWIVRQVLDAFGEQHIDDVIDEVTDDEGNWLPPDVVADNLRQRNLDRGGFDLPSRPSPTPAGDEDGADS